MVLLLLTMTLTALTLPWSSSKLLATRGQLLGLLVLALLAGACSKGPTEIGVGLPDVNANTGAYLVDTLTVKTSTVLRDSVVTSGSSYLLVGRATDPLFGKLTAKSFFRVGGSFTPVPDYVADSAALLLSADTYRYGDTTQVQTLFNVYRMDTPLPLNQPLFSSSKLTPLAGYYNPANPDKLLNAGSPRRARVRPTAFTLRIPLKYSFAQELMTAGKAGLLNTSDQLQAYLAGIALSSADNDDAALVRLSATGTDRGLLLYYHSPSDPSTPLSTVFSIETGGAHCFQVSATDRNGTPTQPLAGLPSLGGVDASATGFNTYIEGALGYQTRLEIPYLNDLKRLGQNIIITSAQITAEVPTNTLSQYIPTPPSLVIRTSNVRNQPIATYLSSVDYKTSLSPVTALEQGSYTWAVTTYVQAALAGSVTNNGFLLSTTTPELPTRLVLGSARNQLNQLRLRVYVISTN
ncbi:MAG: DUF4270 family protein [Deltaproteobacteria bacterium]|nr:MAG: DUF4270 family protein [Deltaproteobacteria bacterium]